MNIVKHLTIVTIGFKDVSAVVRTYESFSDLLLQNSDLIFVGRGFTVSDKTLIRSKFERCFFDIDNSIYNAMNIGLKNVQTKYVTFINSGDLYKENKSINVVFECMRTRPPCIFVSPACVTYEGISAQIPSSKYLQNLNVRSGHPGFIAPIEEVVYLFDENKAITADGLWMNDYRAHYSVVIIDHPIVDFSFDGVSSVPKFSTFYKTKGEFIFRIKCLLKFALIKLIGRKRYFRFVVAKNCGEFI